MLYEIEGPMPNRPTKAPLRVGNLNQGELAVIVEAGDDFGKYVLRVKDSDGLWCVCLNDATIPRNLHDRICHLVKSPDAVKLVFKRKTAEAGD